MMVQHFFCIVYSIVKRQVENQTCILTYTQTNDMLHKAIAGVFLRKTVLRCAPPPPNKNPQQCTVDDLCMLLVGQCGDFTQIGDILSSNLHTLLMRMCTFS